MLQAFVRYFNQLNKMTPNAASSTPTLASGMLSGLSPIGDPSNPAKPAGAVYKTQAEVNAANNFAQDFNTRHNLSPGVGIIAANKPGDPVVPFRTLDGKPYVPQQMPDSMIKKSVPDWVTDLKVDDEWKQPYYLDGNDMVFVDKSFLNSPRFLKPTKK